MITLNTDEIKSIMCNINKQFDFIENDIDLHIESLKAKLDEIHEEFRIKLNHEKKEIIKYVDLSNYMKYSLILGSKN